MRNGVEKSAVYFLTGAILGGVAVAFTTPVSGLRMRRTLRRKVDDCSDRMSEASQSLRNAGGQLLQKGDHVAKSAVRAFRKSPLSAAG